jgi:hypothetical protein
VADLRGVSARGFPYIRSLQLRFGTVPVQGVLYWSPMATMQAVFNVKEPLHYRQADKTELAVS